MLISQNRESEISLCDADVRLPKMIDHLLKVLHRDFQVLIGW